MMEKFYTKPVEVEAVQLTEKNVHDVADWVGSWIFHEGLVSRMYVEVPGSRKAGAGEWIVKIGGSFTVYKDPEFQLLYEKPGEESMENQKPKTTICQECKEPVSEGQRFHHYKYCLGREN